MLSKDEKIAKALKYLYETEKSMYEIAAATDLTEASFSNWMKGKVKPTVSNANAIINYFEGEGSVSQKSTSVSGSSAKNIKNKNILGGDFKARDVVYNNNKTETERLLEILHEKDARIRDLLKTFEVRMVEKDDRIEKITSESFHRNEKKDDCLIEKDACLREKDKQISLILEQNTLLINQIDKIIDKLK